MASAPAHIWARSPALRGAFLTAAGAALFAACTPTVEVKAPEKPITINLNVKLDADVRVRVQKQAEEDVKSNPIF